jgi:hypothetical protein
VNYWQIAAGAFGRNYAEDFLRFGMAFVGGERQIETMQNVALDDRVVLKLGISHIAAVGRVVARDGKCKGAFDKDWLRDFDGWDLPAYCFIEWREPEAAIPVKTLGVPLLARGTIGPVRDDGLKNWIEKALESYPIRARLDPEPRPTQPVADSDILEFLVGQGLRSGAADSLTATFNQIRLLARYYYDYYGSRARDRRDLNWDQVREHETRTFLIAPLLLALGWAEQQIKIELPVSGRRRVDMACFSRPYVGNSEDLVLILESKGFSQGLDYAPDQAREYAAHFPNCQAIVVTNGYCYKAFRRDGPSSYAKAPSAYLNLLRPRNRYPLAPSDVDNGCLEMLRLLLPSSWERRQVRVDDSKRSADSQVVAKPTEHPVPDVPLTAKQRTYLAFWVDLLERLKKSYSDMTTARRARPQSWLAVPTWKGGFTYAFAFSRDGGFRVEVFIHGGDKAQNKRHFEALRKEAKEIQQLIGQELEWQRLDHRKACRIAAYRPGDVRWSEEELDKLKEWALEMYGRFREAFSDRIRGL